jgi:two-component system chemotaxis sensor kinase CheA
VVQYRGQILPLLHLGSLLDIPTSESADLPLQVVVYSENGRSVGLVVDRIADIVESAVDLSRRTASQELLASIVIQQRVTDLLNLPALIRRADPTFYDASASETSLA